MAKPQSKFCLPCDMPCEVMQSGALVAGAVVNTSADGLCVSVADGFPYVGVVTVSLGDVGLRFDALVRWRRSHLAGLRILRAGEVGARTPQITAVPSADLPRT